MLRHLYTLALWALLAVVAGCGQPLPHNQPLAAVQEEEKPVCVEPEESTLAQAEEEELGQQPLAQECSDGLEISGPRRDRALCYKLQPSVTIEGQKKAKGGKGSKGSKTSKSSVTVACCQPQSLIYARCRSGIAICKLGDTSPVQWFSCAKKMGNTTSVPAANSIMLLDVNDRRKIYTGHPVYVETTKKNSNGTWLLRVSHTNYDSHCHLDQDASVLFDPAQMTASFQSGPWSCWARDLKVLGFILH